MKRHTIYTNDDEFSRLKYASMKDERTIGAFIKLAVNKRVDTIISNLRSAGIDVDKEISQIEINEEIEEED